MGRLECYIILLLVISLIFFAASVVILLIYNLFAARRLFLEKKLLVFSGLLIGAIWSLRLAVGIYNVPGEGLTYGEEILNSFIHALQTFSMDEDYTKYISDGRAMIMAFGAGEFWVNAYGVYASILNVIAPIAGGAIIFEMLSSLFPRVRLAVESLFFWKELYFFSELNDRSLSLAQSIREEKTDIFTKPTIVFTDVYVDSEEEKSSERLLSAKQMGAICLSNDLTHLYIRKFGDNRFFLIDEDEINNLRTLTILSDEKHCHFLERANIYLFSQNDIHTLVEEGVRAQLKQNIGDEKRMPLIKPIKGYRNLVCNLLVDMPLYEPLVGREKTEGQKELNVTIFGTGNIGTEMFLSAYWCGQMLDCQLSVNMVSKESRETFVEHITNINPDILASGITDEDKVNRNRILQLYPGKEIYSAPYLKYRYFEMDVYQKDLRSKMDAHLETDGFKLTDSDYIVVALGSDEENLAVANQIKQCMAIAHLKERQKKTVIAYVVYNEELCKLLNKEMKSHQELLQKNGVLMYAFGSLEEVYSYKNIFMEELKAPASHIGDAYDAIVKNSSVDKLKKRSRDEYSYWANIGRAIHMKYKVFSSGVIEKSIFDGADREEEMKKAWNRYKKIVENPSSEAETKLTNRLAWLEHRRWNAFMRSKGFQCPEAEEFNAYSADSGEHKNVNLKLHPCLVECDELGMRADVLTKEDLDETYDMLDHVTSYVYAAMPNKEKRDFKTFDYPIVDFEV